MYPAEQRMRSLLVSVKKVKALAFGDYKIRLHEIIFFLYCRMKINYANNLIVSDSWVKVPDREYIQHFFLVHLRKFFFHSL